MTKINNQKSAPTPDDLFVSEREPPSDNFNLKKVRERLRKTEDEQVKARKQALTHKFVKGCKYFIHDHDTSSTGHFDIFMYIFTYQGKSGKHHVFKNSAGNWITTFTDPQLIGKVIKGAKNDELL